MGNVRQRNGKLFFDFRVCGIRCREQTTLEDTPSNRTRMQKVLTKIETEIALGTFDYAKFFPGSKLATKFGVRESQQDDRQLSSALSPATPAFRAFIDDWFILSLPTWRKSHAATVRSTIDNHLKPYLGDIPVGKITKADILQLRVAIAKCKGRGGNETLSAKTINRVLQLLSQALADAAERYLFTNPAERIKRLKQRRIDIQAFSLTETRQIINAVREDYRPYMIVRFFTGLRTGELHGLPWKYVDFERREIL